MPIETRTDTPSSPHVRGIDPAFRPAIEAGVLSPADAAQRGNREAFAQKLAARHRIRIQDAYDIADNRTSLARLMNERVVRSPVETRRTAGWPQFAASVALVLLAGALVAYTLNRSEPASTTQTAVPQSSRSPAAAPVDRASPTPASKPEVLLDPDGRATLISAARPEAVLFSYCGRINRPAVALAQGVVPDAGLWLGVYYEAKEPRAIAIRKDRATGHWIAGDGISAIPAFAAPQNLLGETHLLARSKP